MRVAKKLKRQGVSVRMTRTNDSFISLEKRSSLLQLWSDASAFVSIHVNSSCAHRASGIETYCLHDSLFQNGQSSCTIQQKRIISAWQSRLYGLGNHLAHYVHTGCLMSVQKMQPHVVDRKVKHAIPRVLLGAMIPSILVEVGFLSNQVENMLLQKEQYRSYLSDGIVKGILSYLKNNC